MINRDLDKIEIPDNIDEFIDKSCTFEEFKKMKEREKNQGIQG